MNASIAGSTCDNRGNPSLTLDPRCGCSMPNLGRPFAHLNRRPFADARSRRPVAVPWERRLATRADVVRAFGGDVPAGVLAQVGRRAA